MQAYVSSLSSRAAGANSRLCESVPCSFSAAVLGPKGSREGKGLGGSHLLHPRRKPGQEPGADAEPMKESGLFLSNPGPLSQG